MKRRVFRYPNLWVLYGVVGAALAFPAVYATQAETTTQFVAVVVSAVVILSVGVFLHTRGVVVTDDAVRVSNGLTISRFDRPKVDRLSSPAHADCARLRLADGSLVRMPGIQLLPKWRNDPESSPSMRVVDELNGELR